MNTREKNSPRQKSVDRKKVNRKSLSRKIMRNRTSRNRTSRNRTSRNRTSCNRTSCNRTSRNRTSRNRTREMYRKCLRGGKPVNKRGFYSQNIKADIRDLKDHELTSMLELDKKYLEQYGDFYGKGLKYKKYQTDKKKYKAIRKRLENFILKKKQKGVEGCYSNSGYPVCDIATIKEECDDQTDNAGHYCIWLDTGEIFDPKQYNWKNKIAAVPKKMVKNMRQDNYSLHNPVLRAVHAVIPIASLPLPAGTVAAYPAAKIFHGLAKVGEGTVSKIGKVLRRRGKIKDS